MRVALSSSSFGPIKAPGTVTDGQPLLDPKGPRTVLGWFKDDFAAPLLPSKQHLFGPRGVCLHPDGSLWVADTGHHRLLGWKTIPTSDNQDADIIIGQRDFSHEGRNGKVTPTAATMNVPTGVCPWGNGLALADPWNHRVLLWRNVPCDNNQPADIILGQESPDQVLANRGADRPTSATLHWPYGVGEVDGKLVVCDTGNRRALMWTSPSQTAQPADFVLGQTDFETRDENAGENVSARSMRWPHGVALWGSRLAISDAGNNRVMVWDKVQEDFGAPCDSVLGQGDMTACDHNMASYYPSAGTLNMPYAIAHSDAGLIVADTANSRLLGWQADTTGAHAELLSAQPDFASKGDNRWGVAERDSVCWPYGLSVLGSTVAIADSGNNRILLWELAA